MILKDKKNKVYPKIINKQGLSKDQKFTWSLQRSKIMVYPKIKIDMIS